MIFLLALVMGKLVELQPSCVSMNCQTQVWSLKRRGGLTAIYPAFLYKTKILEKLKREFEKI